MANQVKAPLVTRMGSVGLNIGVNSSQGQNYGARLSASSFIDIQAGSGNISLSTARGIHLDTQVMETDQGVDGQDTTPAEIGEIKIDAAEGFNVKAWKEDINLVTDTAAGDIKIESQKGVEIEAKTDDVKIKSVAKDVKVEAPAGDFDVDALKIYLN